MGVVVKPWFILKLSCQSDGKRHVEDHVFQQSFNLVDNLGAVEMHQI